jgi:hypothetical protein
MNPDKRDEQISLRDRLAAFYELCFPDPDAKNPTTLWGTVKALWFFHVSLPIRKLMHFSQPSSKYGRDFWEKNRALHDEVQAGKLPLTEKQKKRLEEILRK